MASGEHGQWRRTRNGRGEEKETETKRQDEREITNREEWSEKGKTFVTLSTKNIRRKNNIINLLTFQYCINLSSGILWAH